MKKLWLLCVSGSLFMLPSQAQEDSTVAPGELRIINYHSSFVQHVDSVFVYQFRINRETAGYFWYLEGAPVGLVIGREDGVLQFRVAKNYFLSGRLRYDHPYRVGIGVQSLDEESDQIDTSFTITFYNTEIIPSRVKLGVSGPLVIEEGETVSFRVQCESGTFPFINILFSSSVPIGDHSPVQGCNDAFKWTPGFDFVKEDDRGKEKTLSLNFIGTTKFQSRDTAELRITVKNALNYPQAMAEYELATRNIRSYVLQMKFAFLQLDKRLRKVKTSRTIFDLTSASTALTGTILNTSDNESAQRTGKILPSVGVALVPIKEATAPHKNVEQNQASQIRAAIRRLEYLLTDNVLTGDRDPDITRKTAKLRDELKQAQVQLIDVPVEMAGDMSEEELNEYFNSRKVMKKYRMKRN